MKATWFLIASFWTGWVLAGPFVNLDFETVNESGVVGQVSPNGYVVGVGPAEDLLPGWAKENRNVLFNALTDVCFGAPCWSVNSRAAFETAAAYLLGQMTGNYALVFDVGAVPSGYSLTFSQRGDVPPGATALDLDISLPGARAEVGLDGTLVYERNPIPQPALIRDISAFAGKTVDLEIRFVQAASLGRTGGGLDAVRFVMGPSDTALRILKTPFFNEPPGALGSTLRYSF